MYNNARGNVYGFYQLIENSPFPRHHPPGDREDAVLPWCRAAAFFQRRNDLPHWRYRHGLGHGADRQRPDRKQRPVGQYHRSGQRWAGADLRRDLCLHFRRTPDGQRGGRRTGGCAFPEHGPRAPGLLSRLHPPQQTDPKSAVHIGSKKLKPIPKNFSHRLQIHPRAAVFLSVLPGHPQRKPQLHHPL